ncbi:50S ribosome-binding GTPase [Patescibacteria group bacterium]|nr:50S ribosome-binding GTPase [Patescibacteria group bacterium]
MVKLGDNEITQMRIKRIEKEIRDTPYHKATEHHIGRLRAKLSMLKDKAESKSSKKGGGGIGYAVKKQGDATITLVGPPSVGKSTLLNKLTNANSKIAPYAFTTLTVIPGMMDYHDAKIQILDVPGIIEGAEIGKGRGREVLSVARGSDLLIIMCNVNKTETFDWMLASLEKNGIRVNKQAPNVVVEKKLKGGIQVITNFKQDFTKETVKEISKEFRVANAEITIKEKLSIDRLIDAFSPNRVYVPAIFVVNKIDLFARTVPATGTVLDEISISAEKDIGIEQLKQTVWEKLNLTRVYLVRRDEKPSFNNPLIMKAGQNLKDVAQKIGQEFAEGITRAKIWGKSAKFPGQEVSLSKQIQEGMQVRFL